MRENGYYWIKIEEHNDDECLENGWEIAYYYNGEGWYSIWDGGAYNDDEIFEVDENKLIK